MKNLVKLILITFSLYIMSARVFAGFCEGNNNYTFENEEKICYQSPEFIDDYLEDVIYLINQVKTDGSTKENLKGLGYKAIEPVIGGFVLLSMFSSSGLSNFFENFFIIFKEEYIIRDWVKLTNFKQYFTQKVLKESKKGELLNNIKDINKIKQIINDGDYFLLKFKGNTYKDLYEYIWSNQVLFEKVYYDMLVKHKHPSTISYEVMINKKYDLAKNGNIPKINLLIKKIKENYYKGDILIKCDNNWKKFVKNLKNIICNMGKKELDKVQERFSCNYARLKNALALGAPKKFNCGSIQLADVIPIDERIKTEVKIEGLGKVTSTAEVVKKVKKALTKELTRYSNALTNMFNPPKIIPGASNSFENMKKNIFIANIKLGLNEIEESQNNAKEIFTKVEAGSFSHQITPKFPKISKKIYEIIENLKEIEKHTIKACKNQSPYIGECKAKESKTDLGD